MAAPPEGGAGAEGKDAKSGADGAPAPGAAKLDAAPKATTETGGQPPAKQPGEEEDDVIAQRVKTGMEPGNTMRPTSAAAGAVS